ncbi:hypothetical protein NEFER03_1323 [Nematocida sp. LUAm3]|nr:hypothetical protein NEFER03_1323 [Nematocida sp. LUAm3]KAI5174055.1 hypothetical protein NEFER02_0522 [Nematocida sp. LUAm2]KAI5177202.1 hypothetical protein NEFER01_0477 [Nematocida sp. LUAm1]
MRLIHIESYSFPTRLATSFFFGLFLVTIPFYLLIHYIGILGYLFVESSIYIPDTLYCISYCFWKCVQQQIGISIFLTLFQIMTYAFSSKYISKFIAYAVGVITLPALYTILFGCIWEGIGGSQGIETAVYFVSIGTFMCVVLALLPPFCRRRAHILTGIFIPIVRIYKRSLGYLFLSNRYVAVIPYCICFMHLLSMLLWRKISGSIWPSSIMELFYRIATFSVTFGFRIFVTLYVFNQAFTIPGEPSKKYTPEILAVVGISALALLICSFLSLDRAEDSLRMQIGTNAIVCLFKCAIEWAVPIQVIRLKKAFAYARVPSKQTWVRNNKMHFFYFEVCKFYIIVVSFIIPMGISVYSFGSHGKIPSEISIGLSNIRLVFGTIYTGVDAAMKVLFIGEKLTLPQKRPKRITYTDIAHLYNHSSRMVYPEAEDSTV